MTTKIPEFSPDKPLQTWQERINSYPSEANMLWNVVRTFDELKKEGKKARRQADPRTVLPSFSPEELDELTSKLDDTSALKNAWNTKQRDLVDYQSKLYNTGSNGAYAFKNLRQSPPISILVCPTKQYNTFSHYIDAASPKEIGEFFKAVLHSARQATDEFDEKVANDPERNKLRTYYEQEFDRIRKGRVEGTMSADDPHVAEVFANYINDSREHQFAVRDPRTGKSGFRIAINDSPAVSGNSQAQFHVQVLGGNFLGAPSNDFPLTQKEIEGTSKVITR